MPRPTRRPAKPGATVPARPAAWTLAQVLLTVALVISAYLAFLSLTHGNPIGCGPESDCDRVLGSRWARWFGLPVSLFAVLVDGLTLWGTWQVGRAAVGPGAARAWFVTVLGSSLILGAAMWFLALQATTVGWCRYCLAAHGAGALAAVLLLLGARRSQGLPAGLGVRAGACAAGALAVLVAGQVLHRPPTGRELPGFSAVPSLPGATNAAPASTAATPAPTAVEAVTNAPAAGSPQVFTPGGIPVERMQRPFRFYEGMAAVDLADVPIVGSPTNALAVISLFDYTCHHCREMHPLLEEAQRAFSNQLTLVSLPMPLDAGCNRTVTRTPPSHTNACQYARLSLMVWRAGRERHAEFDHYLMKGPTPPPLGEAVARAVALVGTNALTRVGQDPWVEDRLQYGIALYEAAYRKGQGRMPQLIVGRNVAVGTYPRDELFQLLKDNLGLQRTP
ncbi:MAG: hypothetical protein RJA22_1059 [Verrucomicrobiota bacterium]|jgi:uncharacterized membrane protein